MVTDRKVQVIDADAHVVETERTWEFMDPADAKFKPILLFSRDDPPKRYWQVDGKIRGLQPQSLSEMELAERSRKSGKNIVTPQSAREMDDVALRLKDMDRLGIDVQILHNTLWIEQVTDRPDVERAMNRSWNRWLADIWKQGEGRLRWSCVPPWMSMDAAIEEIRFAKKNGALSVTMRPIEGNRTIVDPYFYPIYEEAERLGLAIIVHIANGNSGIIDVLRSPYDPGTAFGIFRIPTVASCHALITSDIPQRFPNLRWGFIEASAGWVPWVITEARNRYLGAGRKFPDNVLKEYNIYVTCQTDDDIPYILQCAGDDNIIIGTDYGHFDPSSEIDAISVFKGMDGISDTAMTKILLDNPKALYGL